MSDSVCGLSPLSTDLHINKLRTTKSYWNFVSFSVKNTIANLTLKYTLSVFSICFVRLRTPWKLSALCPSPKVVSVSDCSCQKPQLILTRTLQTLATLPSLPPHLHPWKRSSEYEEWYWQVLQCCSGAALSAVWAHVTMQCIVCSVGTCHHAAGSWHSVTILNASCHTFVQCHCRNLQHAAWIVVLFNI